MVIGTGLSYSGQWRRGCWLRCIPSVRSGGVGGDAPVVIVFGHYGNFGVGLLNIGEGPTFFRLDSGGGEQANWEGRAYRYIPHGICR